MGMRDSLEDLLVALGGAREGKTTDELVQNIAITVNPLTQVYAKVISESSRIKYGGHSITEYQRYIQIKDDEIHGTLKHIKDDTRDGNYLVIEVGVPIEPDDEPSLKFMYKLSDDENWRFSTYSSDGVTKYSNRADAILNITDNKHQKLIVRAEMTGYPTFERVYHLNNLKCLKE